MKYESEAAHAAIRKKLARGELRGGTPETIWAGKATAQTDCSACSQPISLHDIQYEVDYPGTRTAMRFHQACLLIWDRYRNEYPPSAGVA